ncbi:MAG: sigma-70 family RNA polymerase sigma factor [Synechococcaceae cyanobacterium RL_1_2]|nr:sigma-70 family RNA polymerase sigma factor [Synechococcaceae cyanobacterium RL_1_2]
MAIPTFTEANHDLIKPLRKQRDQDLVTLFQRYPDQGKYFVALACRYAPITYTLINQNVRSPVQADYLFALTWRHIFYEMRGLVIHQHQSFQNWLIDMTSICINQMDIPPVEGINYDIKAAPPGLWCYLEQALDLMPPDMRLMLVMSENFRWSEIRIAAYLQAEGENIAPAEVKLKLDKGRKLLEESLPDDIQAIYLHH